VRRVLPLIVGLLWGIWYFLPDFWGRIGSFGALYIHNYIVFVIGVVAYRILMHASFSGSQAILIPALSTADWVLVQAVFAVVLWLVVGVVVTVTGKRLGQESHRGFKA
jgi:hypothetical protein